MSSTLKVFLNSLVLSLLTTTYQTVPIWAGGFQVYPIRVFLNATESSTLMTVKNDSPEKLRLQVSVMAWDQNKHGEMLLSPTEDIIFYPTLLAINPGDQRNLRVGSHTKDVSQEKSYRIFVEELPPNEKLQSSGVRFLTKVSIPVFLQPRKLETKSVIDQLALRKGELLFEIKNQGNVHIQPREIRIRGTSPDGGVQLERKIPGWYVLSGGLREYRIDFPKSECLKVKALKVEFDINDKPVNESYVVPADACVR
jgi:fimbrial chaperone protein